MTASTVHGGEGGVSVTLDEILTVLHLHASVFYVCVCLMTCIYHDIIICIIRDICIQCIICIIECILS